jgi:hypothetical protein
MGQDEPTDNSSKPSQRLFSDVFHRWEYLSRGLFQYLLAAAATLFIRAVQVFDETGGTSAQST